MTQSRSSVDWCFCGRLVVKGECPTHKKEWFTYMEHRRRRRDRIGKYSGDSKKFKGAYEKD